ncbi:P-loop containing nucleoside triphosphate hydrolase protein [Flagelloscypha sp. PMI_526]|nr:P-loop containing nucleoside triphosphate hydrolase protein [Flagelloscypha sp. PMI_526]
MDALKNMLSPLAPLAMNSGGIQDTLKLVVLGGTVETARRASVSAWNGFVDSFFLTAHFAQEDYPYDWIMYWLSKQPAWGRSREFDITTRSSNRHGMAMNTAGDLEEDDEGEGLVHGRRKRRVSFMPSIDTTHTIFYRGHWLRITRTQKQDYHGYGSALKISVVARNNDILKKLVLEAKREYEKDAEHRVHIFMADTSRSYSCWRWNGARAKRPMSSIVLQPGVKDMILNDCKDFLSSESWYATRGIPFRRGYLLHGVPGSGKTSLIHSLAGELGLDIYVVSLSAKGMSDNTLSALMGNVPSRCILLLEDLDAAFTRGISRDGSSTGAPPASGSSSKKETEEKEKDDGSTLSLSGLLNSLDGVAAAEGRLLFATTNHIERLDPALSRPGRMDVWINFTNATKWQAEGIFKCFFPCRPAESDASTSTSTASSTDASQKNLPGPKHNKGPNVPQLTEAELSELASKFGEAIPEDEFSVASLQGYLLKNKTRPRECVDEVEKWIQEERETREKLKKEKEKAEKEAKEAAEKEEKEKKEKEEKEKAEKDKSEKKDEKPSEKNETPISERRKAKKTKLSEPASKSEASSPSSSSETIESSSDSSPTTEGSDADVEESEVETSGGAEKKEKWVNIKGSKDEATVEKPEGADLAASTDASSIDDAQNEATSGS